MSDGFRPYGLIDEDLKGREDLFARMNKSTGQCLLNLNPQISIIMKRSGVVEGFPTKETQEILEWIREQLDEFETPNADWDFALERGRVGAELKEILDRVRESALFQCDKAFGFEEPRPRPKTQGEKIGELLLEPFRLQEKAKFQSIPEEMRMEQRDACAKAVNAYILSFDLCLRGKIPEIF